MSNEWLTSTVAAEMAGVPRQRLLRAVDEGELPAYRIGRRIKFHRSEVQIWMDGGDMPEPPAYPQALKDEAVARYAVGDEAEDIAAALGLSPVAAKAVEEWAEGRGLRVRPRRTP